MAKTEKAIASAVAAPFFMALGILLFKQAGKTVPPLIISGLGSYIALPFLFALVKLAGQKLDFKIILENAQAPLWQVLISRGFLGAILITWGFTLSTTVKSILLLRLEPLFVFIWSVVLLKEKPTSGKLLLMLLLLAGAAMVISPQHGLGSANWGDALIISGLFFISYSYIPTKKVVQVASPDGLNILVGIFSGTVTLMLAYLLYGFSGIALGTASIWTIAAYGICFCVFGCTLYFHAFKSLEPWIIASFLSLEVVYGIALALAFAGESVTWIQAIGAGTMLICNLLIARYQRSTQIKAEKMQS